MNHEQLDQKFVETLEVFKDEMKSKLTMLELRRDQVIKKEDFEYLSRQVFYCLDNFRTIIVNHVREEEKGK
ncbi:hypothetical protein ACXFAU_04720 [Paenibacillus glucanolyticus]|uniref:hypothetical protein n=1 Tax=Paenibacillus glucanolyticus TaxID=59843 RepID=UPI0034CF005B